MWILVCKKEFPDLLTKLVTWIKANNYNKTTNKNNKRQVSVC